jgi:N-acetylmuramoyl-L-alanine amidase
MGWIERVTAIVAGVAIVAAVSSLVARSEVPDARSSATAQVETAPPVRVRQAPSPAAVERHIARVARTIPTSIGAASTKVITSLRGKPTLAAPRIQLLVPGVLLPVYAKKGGFLYVQTPDEHLGWVHVSKLKLFRKTTRPAGSLAGATIVIDPGHGGHLPGAKGPSGLAEMTPNLDISRRVVRELKDARVFITRGSGHAGLGYRSGLANRLGAHAFISIHNNALPDFQSKKPGSEVYYQRASKDSKRLAGLIYEELTKAIAHFKITWGLDPFAGAKYRKNAKGGEYYSVLRRTLVPAVIVEGMFISNAPEEALLRQPVVRQIYADAVSRGITRFFETKDPGSGFADPYAKPTPQCKIPGCFETRK